MLVDHKTVIAHVYAHCDFFKNNIWFSRTNRKMIDEMANHGTRTFAAAQRTYSSVTGLAWGLVPVG